MTKVMDEVLAERESDEQAGPPGPDPTLKRLDRFVGTWDMEGRTAGSTEPNIRGRASFRWLPGGFFLEQRIQLDFAGMVQVDSLELVGYDPETGTFPSQVFSNMSPQPLPYTWQVGDDGTLTISVTYGPMDATFHGSFDADGQTFSGAWEPNPGADPTINVPYTIGGGRAA
jgi:hypothetical protein